MANRITGDTTLSEDSLFKLGFFNIAGKRIDVPMHVIDLSQIQKARQQLAKEDMVFGEIFRTYDENKIKRIHSDGTEYRLEENAIKRLWNLSNKDKPVCIFYRYTGKKYLSEDEIKDIVNLHYTYSDLLALPGLPEIFKKKITKTISRGPRKGLAVEDTTNNPSDEEFQEYLNFLDLYIQVIRKRNNKDILGILPLILAPSKIRSLIKFYIERKIYHFYFDFNARMYQGIDSHFTNFQIELEEHGQEFEKTFIYSINGSAGKFTKDEQIMGAKDILTSGVGIDSVGKLHVGGGGKNEKIIDPRVKMKMLQNRVRLFNKTDYGYYKLSGKMPFKVDKTSISADKLINVKSDKDLIYSKLFNAEQLSKESRKLQEYIAEKNQPLEKISSNKSKVDQRDIKTLRRFRDKYSKIHKS